MITQVIKQIEKQFISQERNMYYEKCLQCMLQEDESGLIEILLDNWWTANNMNKKAFVCYGCCVPTVPIFNDYDDWKQANNSDYVSLKEYSMKVRKEDFLDYAITNFDTDLADYLSPNVIRLSPSLQKQVADAVQQEANLVFDRLYRLYTKELVAHLEENYGPEDRILD